MSRPKGSKNRNSSAPPVYMSLPTEERIIVIANLIVDRIIEDQAQGGRLFKQSTGQGHGQQST
jgi:hypothetical protein